MASLSSGAGEAGLVGRLLVVDANEPRRETLVRCLRKLRYSFATAANLGTAIEAARSRGLGAVLLGCQDGAADDEAAFSRLSEAGILDRVPVVVLLSDAQPTWIEHSLALGADDYLAEPFLPAVVAARLSGCVARRQLHALQREAAEHAGRLKLERDLEIGRQIQSSFLPSELPQPLGWEIAARTQAAGKVSGDFYDAFLMSQNRRVGVVIADICDKGIGAALYMAIFRSLIRAYASQHVQLSWMDSLPSIGGEARTSTSTTAQRGVPSTGLTALRNAIVLTNDYIAQNHGASNMFATIFFGVLNPTTGDLAYVNGGHPSPVVVGAAGVKERLGPTGPAVGMMAGVPFSIGETQLAPGDLLFAFTDGVTDARSRDGVLFEEERLLPLLTEQATDGFGLLDRVEASLRAHATGADQADDITMLVVRRFFAASSIEPMVGAAPIPH
ncbi:MAG: SpoIIE family protein phosphatase [Chloroflexi bacterium]|nr:SpoIIE family protein phosphatase [Chloroflexota bacterium]